MLHSTFLRKLLLTACLVVHVSATACAVGPPSQSRLKQAAARGRQFLVGLFDPTLDLLPEYSGASVYWLYHDNYLAARVLEKTDPDLARRIARAIQGFGIKESGKIEIVFDEAKRPLPFRDYRLADVRRIGGKIIRTEMVTERELVGWQEYTDLLLLAALAEKDTVESKRNFQRAMKMWDGQGFDDRAFRAGGIYATYKLALALIAGEKLHERPAVFTVILERLLAQQTKDGGWITDYARNGKSVGVANVETTCLAILAVEAAAK